MRAGKRSRERFHFSHVTTGGAGFLAAVQAVDALRRDEPFERTVLRIDGADAATVMPFRLLPGCVCFWKQPPGVERNDIDVEASLVDVMENDLVLQPEAGGENDGSIHGITDSGEPLGEIQPRQRRIKPGRSFREGPG